MEGVKEKKGGEMVLGAPGGSWVWCLSMQLFPDTHTLPVGVCVSEQELKKITILYIDLFSYFHIRREKPILSGFGCLFLQMNSFLILESWKRQV